MAYAYILQSLAYPDRYYIGAASDLRARLKKHNALEVPYTSKCGRRSVRHRARDPAKGSASRAGHMTRNRFR